ncbi:MAG: hypothetical protein AAF892_05210 [Cyanobacteria bacterium P01_D01_bin.71]
MHSFKSWTVSLIICSFIFINIDHFAFHSQAAAGTNFTSQSEQLITYRPKQFDTETHQLTPEEMVRRGFDAAQAAGEIAAAFEYWISLMPPEMTEVLYDSNVLSAVVTVAESLGKLNSYELLGTVSLENLNTQLRSQLVYSKLAGKGWSSYSRFTLLETLDGWRIIDVEFQGQRSQIIDGFTSLILESEDAQRLIERALSYAS